MDQLFERLGLTEGERAIYQVLLEKGTALAGEIIKLSGLKRGNTYNILARLRDLGLIYEDKTGVTTRYSVETPDKLLSLVSDQYRELATLKQDLERELPKLQSQYRLVVEKPEIKFYEGIQAMADIYDDIVATGQSFQLVRAKYHQVYQEEVVPKIINRFIRRRVKRGMGVEALTPKEPAALGHVSRDAAWLFDRVWVNEADYNAPVEIDIYDKKVAFLSFGKELIGMVIESEQIALAMKQLFALARIGARKTTVQEIVPQTGSPA